MNYEKCFQSAIRKVVKSWNLGFVSNEGAMKEITDIMKDFDKEKATSFFQKKTSGPAYTFVDTSVEDKKGVIFDTEEEAECMAFRYLKETESEKDDIHIVKIMKG